MKKISISFIISLAIIHIPLLARTQILEPPSLQLMIDEALANNPDLEAALKRTRAAEQDIARTGLLPDPKITLGLMNLPINTFSFSQEPMTGKIISISQTFPFPEKLKLSRDTARHEAAAAGYQQQELRNSLILEVTRTYYDLFLIDRSIETVEKNQILMKQLVRAAESKYETGSGLQQDVLRAHLELSRLEDSLLEWRRKRQTAVSRMNHLLNRNPGAPVDKIPAALTLPESEWPSIGVDKLKETRPLLHAWEETLEKARNEIRLTQLSVWPDLMVMGSYTQRDDLMAGMETPDFMSASISFSIPVFYQKKQKSLMAKREIEYEALHSKYLDIISRIQNNIDNLISELDSYQRQAFLYTDGILIQARQALDSIREGYQVNKVDFNAVIENWRSLQSYELKYFTALANFYKSAAAYDQATGQIF